MKTSQIFIIILVLSSSSSSNAVYSENDKSKHNGEERDGESMADGSGKHSKKEEEEDQMAFQHWKNRRISHKGKEEFFTFFVTSSQR